MARPVAPLVERELRLWLAGWQSFVFTSFIVPILFLSLIHI